MEAAIKSRRGTKSWLRRASNNLAATMKDDKCDVAALQTAMREFEIRETAFRAAETVVEAEAKDDKELEELISEASEYLEGPKKVNVEAVRKLQALKDTLDVKNATQFGKDIPANPQKAPVPARLPQVEIAKFNGDVLDWISFWDKFSAIIDCSGMPNVTKFTYLEGLLEGDAKRVIAGLNITDGNYPIACKLLNERFNKKEKIIFAHVQSLLSMGTKQAGSNLAELSNLYDSLQTHIRSLTALDVTGKQYGVFLTPMILACLPTEIQLEWDRGSEGHESDLDYLLKFLCNEIRRRDCVSNYHDNDVDTTTGMASAAALHSYSNTKSKATIHPVQCGICGKAHPTVKCFLLTKALISERKERVKRAGLCFRCLGSDSHVTRKCKSKNVCKTCKRNHHSLLHEEMPVVSPSGSSTNGQVQTLRESSGSILHANLYYAIGDIQ